MSGSYRHDRQAALTDLKVHASPWRFAARALLAGASALGLLITLPTTGAHSTTFIPMSIENLTRSSAAVVMGKVERITGIEKDGTISTLVRIRVEDILKGNVAAPVLTLRELGGRVGERQEVVFGVPSYQVGEHVLVFVSIGADGSLRTNQLALGKFRIETSADGNARARQDLGEGTLIVVPPGGIRWQQAMPLDELLERIGRAVGVDAGRGPSLPDLKRQSESNASGSSVQESTNRFTLRGGGRFFEADEGGTLSFLIDERGDDILGMAPAHEAVNEAFDTWTAVTTATISLADGGLTSDLSLPCETGLHKVIFNDPNNEIDDPVDCTGTLAVGGYCTTSIETKFFNGTMFNRAVRGEVTFADNWEGCEDWTPCNFAEVATHELGHAIGLGHSSEDENEADFVLSDATMYFLARFDGRCAEVRQDDIDGLTFIYPVAIPPTITTPASLPQGVLNVPYRQTLNIEGGTGSFTWTQDTSQCTGFPGLDLTEAGVIEGIPAVSGSGCFQVTATDGNGDSHSKVLDILVARIAVACAGDCNGDNEVAINELILGVNIALGSASVEDCPSFDTNGDAGVAINELITAVNNALGGCPA